MGQIVITLTQMETGGTAAVSCDGPMTEAMRQHLGNVALNAVQLIAVTMDAVPQPQGDEGAPDPIDPNAPPLMDGDDDGAPFAGDPDSPGHPE